MREGPWDFDRLDADERGWVEANVDRVEVLTPSELARLNIALGAATRPKVVRRGQHHARLLRQRAQRKTESGGE